MTFKKGCAAANPRLLRGKPLDYGTVGLLNGNIYLRYNSNVMLAQGNDILSFRRKPDAMTLLPDLKIYLQVSLDFFEVINHL